MTFISQALYDSLKASQRDQLATLADLTSIINALTIRVKDEESFLASVAGENDKLAASIANDESENESLKATMDNIKAANEALSTSIESKEKQLEDLNKELKEEQDKEEPDEAKINEINGSITAVTNSIKDLKLQQRTNEDKIEGFGRQIDQNSTSIAESKAQVAENNARKDALEGPEGELADLKASLQENQAEFNEANTKYETWVDKNQETINTFELQDKRRNSLIREVPNREVFNRALPTSEGSAIDNEKTVLQEVVASDLDITNLTPTEKDLLDKAIEDARKEDFDPSFLTADQAASTARAANFSLLPVSKAIKEAAMNGLYSIVIQNLSDSNIYALEQAKYTVILTPNALPEFEIRWDKITADEEE
jgi:chromosome segregation ATPase